eukprot:5974656-Pleurochrysis_carterae.AAC.1
MPASLLSMDSPASFVRRRRSLEGYSHHLFHELQGGGPAASLQGRRAKRSRVPERSSSQRCRNRNTTLNDFDRGCSGSNQLVVERQRP